VSVNGHTPARRQSHSMSIPAIEPLTQSAVSGSELGVCVAGVGFEPT
jgi:hypothetical protein